VAGSGFHLIHQTPEQSGCISHLVVQGRSPKKINVRKAPLMSFVIEIYYVVSPRLVKGLSGQVSFIVAQVFVSTCQNLA
jgi:hypothetical protein